VKVPSAGAKREVTREQKKLTKAVAIGHAPEMIRGRIENARRGPPTACSRWPPVRPGRIGDHQVWKTGGRTKHGQLVDGDGLPIFTSE
jgi:hypothetical protein